MALNKKQTGRSLLFALFGPLVVIGVTAFLWFIWIPNHRLEDSDFIEHASSAELRQVAERALRTPWGNHHDACLLLSRVGNVESVPLLVRSLHWHEQPSEDSGVECTTIHCADALRQITGHDAGMDPRSWQEWLSASTRSSPPTEPAPQ
jgi:hypothetical protein